MNQLDVRETEFSERVVDYGRPLISAEARMRHWLGTYLRDYRAAGWTTNDHLGTAAEK